MTGNSFAAAMAAGLLFSAIGMMDGAAAEAVEIKVLTSVALTSALDELTREVLNEELIRIWQSADTRLHTVMMVTHSIPEAVTMSDRVIVLTGRPAQLIEDVDVRCSRPRAPEEPEPGSIIKRIRAMVRGGR